MDERLDRGLGGRRPSSLVPRPSVEVAAGLVFREGKLLVTQRHADAHLGGLWEFPGGKREVNESFEECLIRELREELGIEVTVGELVESIHHEYPDKAVYLRFFRCQWKEHEARALGCSAIKWVSADELGDYDFPAADARLLDRLRQDDRLWVTA
jgi:mutator protein MutT